VRVLLDECVPGPLRRDVRAGVVMSSAQLGWKGKGDGGLLSAMKLAGFDVLITVDKNLPQQQNIAASGVAVIVLRVRTNTRNDVLPLAPRINEILGTIKPGEVVTIDQEDLL
jgi:hypothetical protein